MQLSEENVIITGGANGVGLHLVEVLKKRAKTVIVLDKDREAIESRQQTYDNVHYHYVDLTVYSEVKNVIAKIYSSYNAIGVLINNAGLIHNEPLINLLYKENPKHKLSTWHNVIDTNLNSVFYVTSHLAEKMIERRHKGVIINVSSVSAAGMAGQSAYSASKAAINALTKTWSKELGMFGIRCNAIAPGFFDTPSTNASLSESKVKQYVKSTPVQRLGQPKEIAEAIEFIIANEFYNGSILNLDGGFTL